MKIAIDETVIYEELLVSKPSDAVVMPKMVNQFRLTSNDRGTLG
jgi:hypothetical protein